MMSPKQVAIIVGASRGIGRQVAIDFAKVGYAVVVTGKTTSDASKANPWPPDPNSPQSTITTVEREIRESGGEATAIPVDTRDPQSVQRMVDQAIKRYGRLDVLVYNSGAIWWASVENTPTKRFQLMQRVNPEGTWRTPGMMAEVLEKLPSKSDIQPCATLGLYATVQSCLPYFKQNQWKGRIIVVSPPIYSRFFRGKTAYAMGKVGMSVLTKGLAMDWVREGKKDMSITSIWPATAIESAATQNPQTDRSELRKPTIFSDAILAMIRAPVEQVNGCLELDEDFLCKTGVTDFSHYSVIPGTTPRRIMPAEFPDLTVTEQGDEGRRMDSAKLRASRM